MTKLLKTAALAIGASSVALTAVPAEAKHNHRRQYQTYNAYQSNYDSRSAYGEPVFRDTRVWQGDNGQYYGVQGTTWRNPPILDHPSAVRTVKGRKLLLFRTGAKLRLVAWKTDKAAYWDSNTLNSKLSNAEMLALASSVRPSK